MNKPDKVCEPKSTALNQEQSSKDGTSIPKYQERSWLKQHWRALLGAGVFVASATISLTQFNQVERAIDKDLPFAVPSLIGTELTAWTGAAMIFGSAGNKIGNPLTLKSRLEQVKDQLNHNRMYNYGLAINILGATGTSAVVAIGAVTSAPIESWPLAFSIAGASLGFSGLPWIMMNKSHPNPNNENKE